VTDLAHRAVAVVGHDIDDDGDAPRAVTLEADLLVVDAFQLAGAAQNRALDVLLRHVFRLGSQNGCAQAGVHIGVTAALCGDSDLLEQTSEYLAALGIERALLVLDCGPL